MNNNPIAQSTQQARAVIEDAWAEMSHGFYMEVQLGLPPTRLPDLSLGEAQRRSAVGSSLLTRLSSIDAGALPHDLALSLRVVHYRAQIWAREADWYWHVIDPMGLGFFGMFLPTAYCGGYVLNAVQGALLSFAFNVENDRERYLDLLSQYAGVVQQVAERTAGQRNRGMLMPRPQIPAARSLLAALQASARTALKPSAQRLAHLAPPAFEQAVERCTALFGAEYLERAPEEVGLGQYPEGQEIYAALVKLHTTLALTPKEVHTRGLERMAEIQGAMHAIRAQLGFGEDAGGFLQQLQQDARWRATTPKGVSAVFQRYIDRLAPKFREYFPQAPAADYGVAPLPQALEGSMTFGYYDAPRPGRNRGEYLFNAANLTKQPLFNVGALTYHELVPGHHLHLSTQRENAELHPLRQHSFVNAYNEGWAEYAATFAGEIGMYPEPEERYGRLVMDAFLTCRLVVDTGMNSLGWSLEQARDYMRLNSGMSETEILSETLRYSCDIPGQSLAYKLGDTHILKLRERMRAALGLKFDIRIFHGTVLRPGALPLPDLEWHVDRQIEQLRARP